MERIQIIIKRTLILFSMLVACGVIGQLLLIERSGERSERKGARKG